MAIETINNQIEDKQNSLMDKTKEFEYKFKIQASQDLHHPSLTNKVKNWNWSWIKNKFKKNSINKTDIKYTDNETSSNNIQITKNEITENIISLINGINNDWEDFMTEKQKEVRELIQNSDRQPEEKDNLRSQIYTYEIIDIKISEIFDMINNCSDQYTLKKHLYEIKKKIIKAIQNAAEQQIKKYNTINI